MNVKLSIREDFPILAREVHPGVPLVYLDSTATAQKPLQVLQAMQEYYERSNGNIHRGVHTLAEEATALYENARQKIADFIHASDASEIIYTRNTTESINLVAYTWGRKFLNPGDLVILTEMEHHSNLVAWQILAQEKNLRLEFIPVNDEYLLDLDEYRNLLAQQPKLVAFTHMSNVLGTIKRPKRSSKWRMPPVQSPWWMARNPCRTSPWMCRIWTPTSWRSRRTRCAVPPELACCMAKSIC